MESSNPNASSSSSSTQPPPPLSGYSNASPYSNQQRSTLQSYYSANQPGGGPSSAFHLAQQPHLAPQQQQRPLYPSHQYSNVYGQPPPPQQQQQLHSHLQQSHYAPYPYPFPQPHPHHPHAHPLSLPPQPHHPHPSHPQFQSYQPYGYPPPNYPPPPSNNPNQSGFPPPPPSNPYYLPPQSQQQQYRAPPLSSSQQQGGGGQRLNSRGGGGVVQNLLPDPSASAAAAALVGLPSTNNTSSSSGGGPNSGGGLDAFGLPIPPAHYSTSSSSSTQQSYHPLSQPPPPSQLQHSLHHSRSHSHPHSQLSPFLGGPPPPPAPATSRPPSATSHQSKLLPPPPSNVSKPIHQHPLSHHPLHPPHPHPSNSQTFVTVPSSSTPVSNSVTKPTKPTKLVEKEKKKETKEKEKNVVVQVVPERRSTRPRARTSYKPQYVDSDFDSSDEDEGQEEEDEEEEEETFEEDHDDRVGSFSKGRGGNRKGNGNAKEDVYREEDEEVGNGVGKNGNGKGAVVRARHEQDELTLGENGLMGELNYSEQTIEQGRDEEGEKLHGKGKGKGRNAKASPNKKGKGKALDPVPTPARGKKRTRSESIVEPEQEEEDEYDESGERDEAEQDYDDQNEGEDGRDGEGDPEGDDKRKSARGGWGGAAGSRPDTFLTKLWKMLHGDPIDVKEYLRWDKTGRLLLIPDEKEFVERVCKVYFSQKSITSFNKQMNNWDFKRHSRSQRDLNKLKKHNPDITRETRIWYHTSLHSRSTWDDVANVARHEDGMAKKRRVRSKKTGVEEKAAPRRGRPKGSGGPLKIPGMLSSESEGEEMDEDVEDEGSVEERKPAPTSKRTRASPVKRNARDVEGAEGQSPARKKRRDGPIPAEGFSTSPPHSTKMPPQLDDHGLTLPDPPRRPSVFDPVPSEKTRSPVEEATDVDAPGEADEDDSVAEARPEDAQRKEASDEDQDAEGEIDAEGVADDDTDVKEDQAENESEKNQETPVSTGGRQTRASRGLRGLEPSSINTTTSARGRGGGRGKKANAGLSKEGDDITPEKRDAIAGDDAEGVPNENAPPAPEKDEARGPGSDRANGQNPDAFDIIRQEAPRPKSHGGGWYLPARVADGKLADGLEQQPRASEDMRRGGAGFPLSEEGSSSAVYALPRPPHLSNLPEVSSPSTPQPPAEPVRSASQPPPQQQPDEGSFSRAPALQVTPPAIHHPQDAPNPYFSDPGQERPPYHSDASGEPAPPRPYIHPAHAVPEDLFVPGVTPQTDENQRPIVHYPVPTSSEQEQERAQERKEGRISRGGDGDFEAQYAKLEAFVSGEGAPEGDGGATVARTEDAGEYSHQPHAEDENGSHAAATQ